MWTLWYLLIYLVLEKLLAILWSDQLWWGYVCCLNWKFHILWPNQWLSYWKVILVFWSFVEGKPELLLFPCGKVCIELCISWYPCSCLSSSIDILLDSMFWVASLVTKFIMCFYQNCVFPCFRYDKSQEFFYLNLWHVCRVILLHVGRDQLCV